MFDRKPIERVAVLWVEVLSITLTEYLKENSVFICVLRLATTSEGNEWNTFIEAIKFADVDSDGDIDIMLINNGDPKLPAGSYLRNNGSMQFTFIKAAKGSNIQRLPQSAFKK